MAESPVTPISSADVAAMSPLLAPMRGSSRLIPPFPFMSDPTQATVLSALEDAEVAAAQTGGSSTDRTTGLILRYALEWALAHADVELVAFLAGLEGQWATTLDAEVDTIEDDEGWGIVGQAIQASCGLSDKEEAVRVIVGRWGVLCGPRGGRDRHGWTALHLAALLSSPQIVSVLLNRGASPTALTDEGMSAYDLVLDMEGREPLAVLLDPLHDASPPGSARSSGFPTTSHAQPPLDPHRRELIQRRRYRSAMRGMRDERRAARLRTNAERERWVRERAKHIGVNASVLFPAPKTVFPEQEDDYEEEEEEEPTDEMEETEINHMHEQLVFSLPQLPFIFDALIAKYPPLCQPRERRALPANALFLYARFAHYSCDGTWLEELFDGAIERIERGVYSNGDDLAYLAFWEYNLTLLLALIKSDEPLMAACIDLNLLGMVTELINAIHVFVIRIAERKIDESLDSAMLDFESLDDFEEVRFQDQWNIFRSLTARKKRETPRAAGIFAMPGSPSLDRRSDYGGDSPRRAPISPSPARSSIQEFKAETREALANGIEKATALFTDNKPSPRKVTDVLTNVLVILQLYDVNPAFIVQVFSQTFYWIASELFNRIITRKKYLCRTKAVQIRMNITVLEEWTRTNGLPPRVASRHLEPVMQLLQWLQCLSQINQFDMLIGTVQNLRALNPLQMRRAVRDYRFEVDEGRMADDCVQYLAQMQKDWERRRVHIGVNAANQAGGVLGLPLEEAGDESMSIEALFDSSVGVGEWAPQSAPECIGELVDSRFMLPFLVPTSVEFLLATPPPDSAFRNLPTEVPPNSDGTPRSRPISISSYTSTKPMGWDAPSGQRVRRLPDDFLPWLKERQAEYSRERGMQRDKLVDPGRPAPPSPEKNLPSLPEHPVTPTKSLPRVPQSAHNTPHSTPSDVHARKASTDMAMRRSQADMTPPGVEPIEMSFRPSQNGLASPSPAAHAYPPTPSRSQGQPPYRAPSVSNSVSSPPSSSSHYELGRVPHERQASVSSQTSVSSSSGSGKRWLKAARQASVSASPEDLRRREREDTADTIVPNMPSPSPRRREVELASPQGSPVRR